MPETQKDDILEQILSNRGISTRQKELFIHPDFINGLHNPFDLPDMQKAVKRISQAIQKKEVIGIFGDYDADGIPAAAILSEIFEKKFHLKTIVYIPTRKEGYGLNKKAIDELSLQGVTLLITVDLGIRELENSLYASGLGMDVIITDHHEPGQLLPKAVAVINPKIKESKYPFRELSGGGVAFKLVQALEKEFTEISEADLKWLLDLVAISTICDVVPLIDENRIFAKYGLLVLKKTKRLGLLKLYEKAKIDSENITTYTVGFQIGPRINAPGRMGEKNEGYLLLRSDDPHQANELAEKLNQINSNRQQELERVIKEITKKVNSKTTFDKIIIFADSDWPAGLVGLAAGRVAEEFYRPTFILEDQGELLKGSARSLGELNLVELLESKKNLLENFGGHAHAAGLTIKKENYLKFIESLNDFAKKHISDMELIPLLKIDAVLPKNNLSLSLFDQISQLEPYGLGNPKPVFAIMNAPVDNFSIVGKTSAHLKFKVFGTDAIWFNCQDVSNIKQISTANIAFYLDENVWQDKRKLQLRIIDLKPV